MIGFEYSTEQKEIRDLALRFAKNDMQPYATEFDQKAEMPFDILKKAWELGLYNTCIPAENGGTGFSNVDAIIINEALAYGCLGMNTSIMANDLALLPIVIGGTGAQKETFLTPFVNEFKIAAFCLTEPSNGSDAAGIKTTIKEDGDYFVLNGQKMWITNAGFADLFIVYATTDSSLKHRGISCIVVEKGTEGIEIGAPEKKMGHRCSDTRSITFNNVKVSKENLIGKLNEGWQIAMKTLNHSRPMVAASAVGGAQAAIDHAVQYAIQRKQFGVTINKHQAIQLMIAEMAMNLEAARLLTTKAAWLHDQGRPDPEVSSYAKAFAADTLMKTATDAVQIFGGYGYSSEYPVEKIMRDAKLIQIYEGTSQIQRLVIAKEIFSKI